MRFGASAVAERGPELLVAVGLMVIAAGLLHVLPDAIEQDTWLALVDGRLVAQHGIPHHVTLIAFAHGRPWVDQQWLAQLWMYWLYRAGGMALLGVVNVGLVTSAILAAIVASRRLGASTGSVIRVLPLAAFGVAAALEVRTQPYAYPLAVAVMFLLARDSRQPSRAVYWCLPLLILWANVHGSATLGAGLVVLRGLTSLWERRRALAREPRAWLHGLVLIAAPTLCLLATPYGTAAVSYYRATLLEGNLSRFVTEWQPVTTLPVVAVPFFLLAAITVWSFGRHAGRTTVFERCALLVLAAGAIIALRNVVWFSLATLIVLPVSIDLAVRSHARSRSQGGARTPLNLALVAAAAILLVVELGQATARSPSSLEPLYPDGALAQVRNAVDAGGSTRVYADERFADWLLWRLPQLRGRVAYDASFELLSTAQLQAIYDLKSHAGDDWDRAARGYRLLVLDSSADALVRAFQREPGTRRLFGRDGAVVLERPVG
ncbi:MAG TPA: hypothetical protein VJU80_16655 [Solirubrobacteraceae bacterium]|nr:hypothetical protein [Solirubrobacteraceae bacterium]